MTHTKSPVIESQDYYPFGLQYNSYSRENTVKQDYLYNGKELQDELNLGWLDYGARMYMSDIGRWGVIDPLSHRYFDLSPYNYGANDPVLFTDPTGAYITIYYEEDGEKKEYRYENGTAYEGNNSFVANTVSQLDYIIANPTGDSNPLLDLAEHKDFNWGIKNVSMESFKKKERMQGDGITTLGTVGSNYAETTYNDLVGFETNTGGFQSPSTTLLHEGGHANQRMKQYDLAKKYLNTRDPKYLVEINDMTNQMAEPAAGYLDYEEKYVNDNHETPFAQKMGEGIRTSDYGNRTYQTAGPFTTLPANVAGPINIPSGQIPPSVLLRIKQ